MVSRFPNIVTLNLGRWIADGDDGLVFLKDKYLAEQRMKEQQGERKTNVWKGFIGRPGKAPDFMGQSRIVTE